MSSRVVCPCGQMIVVGGFPNAYVSRVISEASFDSIEDPLDRKKLGVVFLGGRRLIECPVCQRIMIKPKDGDGYVVYVIADSPEG